MALFYMATTLVRLLIAPRSAKIAILTGKQRTVAR
jgi:hypothetical protein